MSSKTLNPTVKYSKNYCQGSIRHSQKTTSLVAVEKQFSTLSLGKMSEDIPETKRTVMANANNYVRPVSECSPPPIGVYWDIENCSVPFGKSALSVVMKIREKFFEGYRETDFMVVCDISKENKDVIQELNNAQVTVVHINATSKNTADDKIRQALRRFAADHCPPAAIILISGDVNFASELSDLRYRHHLRVILIHRRHAASALVTCAHEHYCFDDFVADVEDRSFADSDGSTDLVVGNLPMFDDNASSLRIRTRLRQLGSNCRGRVISVLRDGTARMRFPNQEATLRAQKRMDGEDVYGYKIRVQFVDEETCIGANGFRNNNVRSPRSCSVRSPSNASKRSVKDFTNNFRHRSSSLSDGISYEQSSSLNVTSNFKGSSSSNSTASRLIQKNTFSSLKSSTVADFRDLGCQPLESSNGVEDNEFSDVEKVAENKCHLDNESSEDDVIICGPEEEVDLELETATNINSNNNCVQNTLTVTKNKTKKKKCIMGRLQKSEVVTNIQPSSVLDHVTEPDDSATVDSKVVSSPNVSVTGGLDASTSKAMDYHVDSLVGRLVPSVRFSGRAGVSPRPTFETVGGQYDPFAYRDLGFHGNGQSAYFPQPSHGGLPFEATPYSRGNDNASRGCDALSDGVITPASIVRRFTPPDMSGRTTVSESAASRTPSFRRTPGARRPNLSSGPRSYAYQCPPLMPKPLFAPCLLNNAQNRVPCEYSAVGDSQIMGRRFPTPRCDQPSAATRSDSRGSVTSGIELVVSNLDYNISMHEWKKILQSELQHQVQVLSISMQMQPDNTSIGFVRVPTAEEARHAVAQFHRKKIGYKRIHVALRDTSSPTIPSINNDVVELLKETPTQSLPLHQFIEVFEERFRRGISVPELYHMRGIIEIADREGLGKVVVLTSNGSISPMSISNNEEVQDLMTSPPICPKHAHAANSIDAMDMGNVPHVILQLRNFSTQVHILLQHHDGSLPLASFPLCYGAEFSPLHPVSECGVPLEHLITCVSGVQVSAMNGGARKIHWVENGTSPTDRIQAQSCSSPLLSQQLTQFSHDVIDLLRHSPQCRQLFSKFIPSYHHHFGRQCRVTEFGFSKLIDLFDAVPHIVQVIGEGTQRYVTLTHRAQVKRFTADLLRILKSQASKQISVAELPAVYGKLMGRAFDITEYGLCFIEDFLAEMTDVNIMVSGTGAELTMALPRRDQTSEEIERTKQFSVDVVDLLKHSPRYRLPFSRFIPGYHHHFGRQCRVADYGFTKLIELLEAVPHVVTILDDKEEKVLCLTEFEMTRILEENVISLLRTFPSGQVPAGEFFHIYSMVHRHCIRLDDFGVRSIAELVAKIPNVAKVEVTGDGRQMISLVDNSQTQTLTCNVLLLLMDKSDGSLPANELAQLYEQTFKAPLTVAQMSNDLREVIQVNHSTGSDSSVTLVKLCALQMFARDARTLLMQQAGSRLALSHFERAYSQYFGVSLTSASYGFPSLVALIQAVPLVLSLNGKTYNRRIVSLTSIFQVKLTGSITSKNESLMPYNASSETDDDELSSLHHHDLLDVPVPSNVPSPDLHPLLHRPPSSLMRFDAFSAARDLLTLTEDEKKGLKTPLCRTPVSELLQFAAQFLPTGKPSNSSSHLSDLVNIMPTRSRSTCTNDEVPQSNCLPNVSSSNSPTMVDVSSSGVYPPMPAAAQHVSVVQARILRSSTSSVSDLQSPESAHVFSSTIENANRCSSKSTVVEGCTDSCTISSDVEDGRPTSTVPDSDGSCSARSRLTTPRRSRVVARFGLIGNDASQM